MKGGFPPLSICRLGGVKRQKRQALITVMFSREKKTPGILASVIGGCAAISGCQSNCGSFLLEPFEVHVYQTTAHAYQVRGNM